MLDVTQEARRHLFAKFVTAAQDTSLPALRIHDFIDAVTEKLDRLNEEYAEKLEELPLGEISEQAFILQQAQAEKAVKEISLWANHHAPRPEPSVLVYEV